MEKTELIWDYKEISRQEDHLLMLEQRVSNQISRLETLLDKIEEIHVVSPHTQQQTHSRKTGVTFLAFMSEVIEDLCDEGREGTVEAYQSAYNSFSAFLRKKDIYLDEVTDPLIKRYELYLLRKGLTKNTSSFYMRILRAVYNRAISKDLVEMRFPFKNVYVGVDKTIKRALNMAAIKRIKNVNLKHSKGCDFARDMFLFSFYMRGMSFVDMANLRTSNLSGGYITYKRRKTGQELCIRWEHCMQEIVDKYKDSCQNGYLLPIIKKRNSTRNQYKYCMAKINKNLRDVAIYARIYNVQLTLYVARHSWASIAKSKRIPMSVISQSMGHDNEKTTRIYLASLDKSVIDRANRQILGSILNG